MLKKTLHKSFSMLMAFLVLFSTVSFTIQKHFCGDTLMDIAIFSEAQKCITEALDMEQSAAAVTKMDCCKDELEIVKGQDVLKLTTFDDLHFDQQFFLTSFIYSFSNIFEGLPTQIIPHKDYSPPNLVADIHLLDQVFII